MTRSPGAAGNFTVRMMQYRLIDLFAGCGAMTRGFVDAGRFRPVFAVESDPEAAATYAANFPNVALEDRPIELVEDFPSADIVIGGPPCQGFSTLNRRSQGATSRRLWREYLRALDASNPTMFVMENVPQLLDSPEYAEFLAGIEAREFLLEESVLNVADYGVPQRRQRAIIIGTRLDHVPWASPSHADPKLLKAGREPWVTFAEAVEGLPPVPDEQAWHRQRSPWPETVRRYQAVPHDGGNRFQMQEALESAGLGHLVPPCWRKHRSGSHDVFGRLWWNRPATTIRTEFYKPEKGRYLHPFEDRAITVREAARLMSFPDDLLLPEDQSMTAIARQVGNAVPPLIARCLADPIAQAMDGVPVDRELPLAA